MVRVVVLVLVVVSEVFVLVILGIGVGSGVGIRVCARCCISVGVCVVGKQPDSPGHWSYILEGQYIADYSHAKQTNDNL